MVARLRPEYPVRTPRLALRPWRPDDLERYHQLRGDPEVARYLYDEPMGRDAAADRLAGLHSEIDAPDVWMNLAVELVGDDGDPSGRVVGDVGLCWRSEVHAHAEIGYVLHPDSRGQGYATEAATALVDLAFSGLGAHRVSGQIDARNRASAAVLERLGLRQEGHLVENEFVKGEWTDEVIYAVLDREWSSRRPVT